MKKLFYILFFVLLSPQAFAQNIDSLKLALKNAKHDTTRCNILNEMIEAENDDEVWPLYNTEMKNIAEILLTSQQKVKAVKIAKKYLAEAFNNIGFIFDNKGNISKALENYGKGLKIREDIEDKYGIAMPLNNLGFHYKNHGGLQKALVFYSRSFKIDEEMGDKQGMAHLLTRKIHKFSTT